MNRRWICNDVWMDIFPSFDRPQLGLKLALLSPRFNALVDKHFNGKSELTIWRPIEIRRKDKGPEPKLSVQMDDKFVEFPLPDRPLPSKIRFKWLRIEYIGHSVIAFLRSNHQIFDKRGTNLYLWIPSSYTMEKQQILDIFGREIWPIFSANIRHLGVCNGILFDKLRRRTSPTILTDLDQLNSIYSGDLSPAAFGDGFDVPNSTISAGQALSKWLHIPRKDGQPKRLRFRRNLNAQADLEWINNFKEHFLRATISSVSYEIHFTVPSMQMMPFELVNVRTQEKLALAKVMKNKWGIDWIMKRCKIGEAVFVQQQKKDEKWINNFNNVIIWHVGGTNSIGPLSPPPAEEMN